MNFDNNTNFDDYRRMNSIELAWKIRRHAIDMVYSAHASHIACILSCADILAILYNDVARINPKQPTAENRDRVILSKGHAGVAIYAVLAECNFFDVEKLMEYGKDGSAFSCHVSHKNIPGVELSTGSLGHGIGVACGMALNAKLRNKLYHVYAIVGDGECNEGSVWEAAMLAAQHKLYNFTVIIDCNGMQAMGWCRDIINLEPLSEKWQAFGWKVLDIKDGNDHVALKQAFNLPHDGKPKVIIAHTIKGKGVSFMENDILWHYRDPRDENYEKALAELEAKRP